MRHSLKTGFCFGLTSGIITTLGLIVGLHASTYSQIVVIGGIFTIAIADAASDAHGIYISEESEGKHTIIEMWGINDCNISHKICCFFFIYRSNIVIAII